MRYSSVFLVVMLLCFAAVVAASASSALLPHKTFDAADDGSTATVKKGETLRVSLPENPSTGYSWNLSLSDGLHLVSDQYVPDSTSTMRVGAGGIHTWDIRATGIGIQSITGSYRRPWEVASAPAKTFALKVRVTGGGLQAAEDNRWRLPRMFQVSRDKFPQAMFVLN
jgi:inhibitor of cysteine peptidase